MKKNLIILSIAIFACFSCSRQISRVSADQQIDLSGRWNDTDSQQVSKEMIGQIFTNSAWVQNFEKENKRKPVVIVGLITNKTSEHIDAETFIRDIEKNIIMNGTVRLVQAGNKREDLRKERADQQDYSSKATIKKWGRELGADFMLQGDIASIIDQYKKEKLRYYQINLSLSNLESNEIVWLGDKKIKKYINR
ncbi:MAG: penicillin-binding protein activator LpoB [Marinifilaceae bacterium]|jgi:uncharacterized protein (TIGR02722 family)|nr:penicillin-binding protein activator LpoB [Marinifilaceae bacterium]